MTRGVETPLKSAWFTVLPENPEHFLFGDQPPSGERFRGCECNREWLLKKSIFLKTAEIWGIENVYPNRESRL
jgi:hypothetical protein